MTPATRTITAMLPLTATPTQRRGANHHNNGATGFLKPSCLFQSLVPAALLCFGALSLLLAHRSLGTGTNDALYAHQQSTSKFISDMVYNSGSSSSSLLSSSSSRTSFFSSNNNNDNADPYFTRYPPDVYQEAFYLDDESDYETPQKIYEDAHVLDLLAKHQINNNNNNNKTFMFTHPNGTSIITDAGIHPIFTVLRDVATAEEFFNPVCYRYRFPDVSLFPTMSIIAPMQNERPGLLAMTVHSLLARTPPEILHEIIIIDDNGSAPEERRDVEEDEINFICDGFHPKIRCIRNERKQGCAGSRLQGIRAATGDVIMVIDSHVEMYSSTWAQHLLLPILENPRTVSMQTLDSLEDLPGHKRRGAGSTQNYGVVSDSFLFSYVGDRFADTGNKGRETPPTRLPFETPFAPGSLFAMRRDEFWRLGGYDEGLAVWGGENTELALKVWTCGYDGRGPPGRIVVVPCSRVGHVYRVNIKETGRWPPPLPYYVMERYGMVHNPGMFKFKGHRADNFTKLVVRNNLRILHVWGQNADGSPSNATLGYYRVAFDVNTTDPMALPPGWRQFALEMQNDTALAKQLEIKKQNKCKPFDWFDRHILFKLVGRHHPWYDLMNTPYEKDTGKQVSCGQHNAPSCGLCPKGHGEVWCNGDCHWCPQGPVTNTGKRTLRLNERTQCVSDAVQCFSQK